MQNAEQTGGSGAAALLAALRDEGLALRSPYRLPVCGWATVPMGRPGGLGGAPGSFTSAYMGCATSSLPGGSGGRSADASKLPPPDDSDMPAFQGRRWRGGEREGDESGEPPWKRGQLG